jgi:iron-sulfur cluster assembly protein
MIQLSPAALQEILRLRSRHPAQHQTSFRLALQPGSCLEWAYSLSFESTLQPGDEVYSCRLSPDEHNTAQTSLPAQMSDANLNVVIHASVQPYIRGLAIDYSEDLMGGGFRFTNPNATQSCSCGNSFHT